VISKRIERIFIQQGRAIAIENRSLIDIVHRVEKEPNLALCIKANRIHKDMPVLVLFVKPRNISNPSFKSVISITNEELAILKVSKMRACFQPALK
jgi:hypothetical protein